MTFTPRQRRRALVCIVALLVALKIWYFGLLTPWISTALLIIAVLGLGWFIDSVLNEPPSDRGGG